MNWDFKNSLLTSILVAGLLAGAFFSEAYCQSTRDSTQIQGPKPTAADSWFAKDKADHFVMSAFLTGLGYYAANKELNKSDPAAKNLAVGFSLSLGILKEAYDKKSRKGTASWKDLVADVLGVGLGYLIISANSK